ncbi:MULTISPECIES: ImmA/IrrE family metallo-endopeptidase [Thermoactinomyces]|uniref:ImmA/IrrE family metallo-endopeptidase n=1 Tax=Thermoactinomyces daqus TaxID=1329516 RepID=A0A7W1XC61_9BACL|nr:MULTISPECIES: ImmA/IrrE family metallo-endopeptidase [Thermoactinomyces]MBA4543962.1 ImmA/IrrE family metallo-endopeptidase [Thermoactinomyces daqus]MBH8599104.1 ImmA/IrrE family metallo-endopeptidase [Thermoactinomyces sp. CICC 10523]MBH8607964.1 ImmA/IrrE family metallo-endopeptidase [Thermoactinomyces sp. CICC 10521]
MSLDLFNIANQEGIEIWYKELDPPLEAIYLNSLNRPPLIVFANRIVHNDPYFRCIFAEELGHHFTSCGIAVCHQRLNNRKAIEIGRIEFRAMRWAAEFLIPFKKLIRAYSKGITTFHELADYFQVTEEMVQFRFKLLNIRRMGSTDVL